MKIGVSYSPLDMSTDIRARIEYGDIARGASLTVYNRFIDYVARYCAKQYIKEHSAALKQIATQEMVSRRVRKALKAALQEKLA